MTLTVPMLCAQLLRQPATIITQAEDPAVYAALAPRLLGLTAGGLGVLGAVVGAQSGPLQLVYAAAKTPLLLLLPMLIALPALRALWATSEVDVPYRRLAIAGLTGTARGAILAAAVAPVYWLLVSVGLDYHLNVLLFAATIALIGSPALLTLSHAVPAGGKRRWLAASMSLALVGLLVTQTGWVLRPFVARPNGEVSLLRGLEEDVFTSLGATTLSSLGIYGTWRPTRTNRHGDRQEAR